MNVRFCVSMLFFPMFAIAMLSHSFQETEQIINTEVEKSQKEDKSFDPKKDVVIVWDIDMVLTYPNIPAAHQTNVNKYMPIYAGVVKDYPKSDQFSTWSIITSHAEQKRVDQDAPKILSKLREKGAKFLALTASKTGKAKAWIKKKISGLVKLYPHFNGTGREVNIKIHTDDESGKPVMIGDVISSGDLDKGIVLQEVFRLLALRPKLVIVVDDMEKNLEAVKKSLKGTGIKFVGIHHLSVLDKDVPECSGKEFASFWKNALHAFHTGQPPENIYRTEPLD